MTGNTNAPQQSITLQPQQTTEILAANGQNIAVNSTFQGATLQGGALVIRFADQSTLVIKNYAEIAGKGAAPTLTSANGQTISLASLIDGSASPSAPVQKAAAGDDFMPTLTDGTPVTAPKAEVTAAKKETIDMPKAGETVTVTLADGTAYIFGFTMTDPMSVKQTGEQLVITFKNGGEIIIPNYGAFDGAPNAPQLALKDGGLFNTNNFGDVLASAAELNDIEAAAGGAGGAGGRGGFGFQSAYATTPFTALDPIGPINPTQLQYNVSDRRPEPILDRPPGAPVPGAPTLTVGGDSIYEDLQSPGGPTGPAAPVINGQLGTNAGAGDYLVVVISSIDAGWTIADLAGGTFDPIAGTWTYQVPPGQNFTGGPTFVPPADSDIDMQFDVTITQYTNGGTVVGQTTGNGEIIVDAVIDPPSLATAGATGPEDTPIALNVTLDHGGDNDGSEAITSITIRLDNPDANLSVGTKNPDGSWSLTEAELAVVKVIPPLNFSGTINATVTVVEYDTPTDQETNPNNNEATVTINIPVVVTPVPDAPTLQVEDSKIYEDGSATLAVKAQLTDTDGSEQLTVTIQGIPASWVRADSFTASGGTYDAATGTWTITMPAGQNFNGPAPTIYPPANSDVDLNNLVVTATSTETANNTSASTGGQIDVIVDAVIDAPSINANDVSGAEDTPIALQITVSRGDDTLDGSETLSNVTISGVPAGATLSAGTYDAATNTWSVPVTSLPGLTLTPPANFNGTINLTVSVTETDNPTDIDWDDTNNTATVTDTVVITVTPVNDVPTLRVDDAQVKEDHSVPLVINAGLAPNSDATDYLVVTITGIKPGWTVDTTTSGGTYNPTTGTWTVQVPAGQAYAGGPTFTPPADSDVDMTGLNVTVRQYNADGTPEGSNSDTASIIVDAVVDAPTLTAVNGSGNEDTPIPLTINVGKGGDATDGSETLSNITISGVPAGATLSAGTNLGGGIWSLTPAQLVGLKLNPPNNFSGTINLTVSVTDTDNPTDQEYDLTDNTATVTTPLVVTVNAIPDTPNVSAVDKQVKEDNSVALQVNASLNDTDGSEVLTVTISGIKPGWTVDTALSGGTYNPATGTWTLTLPQGVTSFSGGPTVRPPADSDVDMTGLIVTATATETSTGASASANTTTSVIVDAVVDAPTLDTQNASGEEGTAIALNIAVGKGGDATDGSETLSNITISGVPAGATLTAGTNLGGGVWSLTPAQLTGLKINVPTGTTSFNLTVSVTDTDNPTDQEYDLSDNTATVTRTINVNVSPDDIPEIIKPAERTVDETDFGTGAVGVTGNIQANFFSDGPGTFAPQGVGSFSSSGSKTGGVLSSHGVPVTVTLVGDTYVGKAGDTTVFTVKIGANGSYDFKLLGTLDHADGTNPNDSIKLNFGVTATDNDGDSVSTTLTINVKDDGVDAVNDYNTVAISNTGTGTATGNVITGQHSGAPVNGTDDLSEDGSNAVVAVTFNGVTYNVPANGAATVQGNYGTLVIKADGSYTYTLDPSKTLETTNTNTNNNTNTNTNNGNGSTSTSESTSTSTTTTTVRTNVQDVFTYTLRDGDGDRDTATLTFNGNPGHDDIPVITTPAAQATDDTNLAAGAQTVGGVVTANFGNDGPGSFSATGINSFNSTGSKLNGALTSNGVAVTVTLVGNTYVGKAGGVEVFTLTLNANGTYSFTQKAVLDHANASNPNDMITLNFGVTATDRDGDSASTNITINVYDDGPRASNDINSLTMNDAGQGSAAGNVITGVHSGEGNNGADSLSQDGTNNVTSVQFGTQTIALVNGTATIQGTYGTLVIKADGSYTYTLKSTAGSATTEATDVFTYTVRDYDGDTSNATLTLNTLGSTLKVGTNVDDNGTSTTPYEVGTGTNTITGRGGDDVLVGDVGGSRAGQGDDFNFVFVLDCSSSMGQGTGRFDMMKSAMVNMLTDLYNNANGGNINVILTAFATTSIAPGTFDVSTQAGLQAALNFLNGAVTNLHNNPIAGQYTNYEAGLQSALYAMQHGGLIPGAETYTYFLTDGDPNRFVNESNNTVGTGTAAQAMAQILGGDGTNEVGLLQSLSTEVIGVGINLGGSTINNINMIDSDGNSLNITDPSQLSSALAGTNPVTQLNAVGADQIVGGDGNDIIFGDSLNTDALAVAKGIDLPPGAGWEVFARLEAGQGWTRADTLNYIRTHTAELGSETTNANGGRAGGNDILHGGNGNDIIYGQEGNDTIYGGAGNDYIVGGSGNDVLYGGTGADTFVIGQGVDTVKDFKVGEGDVLDMSAILSGYDPLTESIHNFVRVSHSGGNTIVQVDTTGSGQYFQNVAILEGVTHDVQQLVNSGNLIA